MLCHMFVSVAQKYSLISRTIIENKQGSFVLSLCFACMTKIFPFLRGLSSYNFTYSFNINLIFSQAFYYNSFACGSGKKVATANIIDGPEDHCLKLFSNQKDMG